MSKNPSSHPNPRHRGLNPLARLGSGQFSLVLGPGRYLTSNGYVRITSGPDRGKYEHRAILARLCRESCFYPLDPRSSLPLGFTVEHLDHRRTHNCISNLILLDDRIHRWLSWKSWLAHREPEMVEADANDMNETEPHPAVYSDDELNEVPF